MFSSNGLVRTALIAVAVAVATFNAARSESLAHDTAVFNHLYSHVVELTESNEPAAREIDFDLVGTWLYSDNQTRQYSRVMTLKADGGIIIYVDDAATTYYGTWSAIEEELRIEADGLSEVSGYLVGPDGMIMEHPKGFIMSMEKNPANAPASAFRHPDALADSDILQADESDSIASLDR